MNTFENWKADWSIAFTPEALGNAVTMHCIQIERTFARIEIVNKDMMKIWFEMMRQNQPRLISATQMSTLAAGPCKLYMCYLTTNHVDIRDPSAISCVLPMYVNAPLICFQGLMELSKTHAGTVKKNEPLVLMNLSAKMAPRIETLPYQYIFISPTTKMGNELRKFLDTNDVNYNRCVAGTLYSVHGIHSKNKCHCSLEVSDWKEVGIVKEYQVDHLMVMLPKIQFKGSDLGYINVPWATGHSFNIIRQNGWTVEDEGIASLTTRWLQHSNFLKCKTEKSSFLSILVGVDGIHIFDFVKFVTTDPLESSSTVAPSGQESVSETLLP
jgi:hypothetical protein